MSLRAVAVVALFATLTLVMAFPLSWDPGSRALDLGADTRLFLWTLAWDLHALGHHPFSVFDANIFYPEPNTLAYSEHLLGNALVGAPWWMASGNPLLTLNAVVLFSCIGCGAGAYFLARRLGTGVAGALVAGVVFAFSPPRFFRLGQIHLATVQWIPFCLGFLHIYARSGSSRHLVAAVLFFWLQALSGGQSGLYLLLTSLGLLVFLFVSGRFHPRSRVPRDFALAATLALALNAPFVAPYFQVREEVGLRRSLQEAERWSPNWVSFLAAPTHAQKTLLSTVPDLRGKILDEARGYLFPGFLTVILAGLSLVRRRTAPGAGPTLKSERNTWPIVVLDTLAILAGVVWLGIQAAGGIRWELAGWTLSARSPGRAGLAFFVLLAARLIFARNAPFSFAVHLRRWRSFMRRQLDCRMGLEAGFYLFLVVFSAWACLGPKFGLYAGLYRIVPGFDFVRVPSRLSLLTLLGLAILAGKGCDLASRISRPALRRVGVLALLGLLLGEFAAFPLHAPPYPLSMPEVDRWLAERAEQVSVVELPIPDPRDAIASARLHSLYMLHSTVHWHPLVNGYSGHTPAGHDSLYRKLVNFPDEASLAALESLGVRFVVLHRSLYRGSEWDGISERLQDFADRLELEFVEEGDRIYRLIRSKGGQTDRGWSGA